MLSSVKRISLKQNFCIYLFHLYESPTKMKNRDPFLLRQKICENISIDHLASITTKTIMMKRNLTFLSLCMISDHSNTYILSLISLKIKINNSINLKEQSCMLLPNVLDAIPIFASNAFKNISPALHVCTKNFILLNSNYIPLNSIL